MILFLGRATAKESLNAKAKEFAEFFRKYGNTVSTAEEYEIFHGRIEEMIETLNEKYPRTTPFELYSFTKHGVYICPKGSPISRWRQCLFSRLRTGWSADCRFHSLIDKNVELKYNKYGD